MAYLYEQLELCETLWERQSNIVNALHAVPSILEAPDTRTGATGKVLVSKRACELVRVKPPHKKRGR